MNRITIDEIINATGGKLIRKGNKDAVTGVKHDSRECGEGDLFVAIKGENQDGHKYIPQVAEAGCSAVLVSHEDRWPEMLGEGADISIILVEDTEFAMGELAKYYLGTLNIKKVAVTGSVGKTSVRDMIYFVLSEKYNCGRNLKNYNNLVGLPISIFRFDSSTEAAVLEMGMDRFGEIERLSEIVKPEIGVITNIGIAHMERLGSREGIFRAKMEIAGNIRPKSYGGALVYARDEEFLTDERTAGDYAQVSIGCDGRSDYIISDVDDFGLEGIEFSLEHSGTLHRIKLPVPGRHNAINAAIAIAVGGLLGVGVETAAEGLSKADLTGRRLRRVEGKTVTVIDDTYNANPDSMKSALKVLAMSRCSGRKIAVLGDMYELGDNSYEEHKGVGIFARGCGIDCVIAIGENAKAISEGAAGGDFDVKHYENKEDFLKEIGDTVHEGDIVLVKGSRGMQMEEIVEKAEEL